MKTVIIGDVHGCSDELNRLLTKVRINKNVDNLVFVGDLFDRGPDSYGVYRIVNKLREEMGDRCSIVMGNHEDMLIKYVNRIERTWEYNGYETTIRSFNENDEAPPIRDLSDWIKKNTIPYYKKGFIEVVHGGRHEGLRIEEENPDDTRWSRNQFKYGWYSEELTFVGHTPVKAPCLSVDREHYLMDYNVKHDLPERGLLNIDTGCVYGHKLTAAIVDEKKMTVMFIGVNAAAEYY